MKRLDSITNSMDMNLSKLQEIVQDREAWNAAIHGVTKSEIQFSDWTATYSQNYWQFYRDVLFFIAVKNTAYFLGPLLKITRPTDMLGIWSFFARENLAWKKRPGNLSTEGALVRVGIIHGFAALVKKGAPHHTVTHCFLCWHILAKKKKKTTLPASLRGFLSTVIKVFNFIRARVLNHCLLKKSVKKMKSIQSSSYYTEVCQLSRACVPKPFWTLNKNIQEKASLSSQ